jgi:hypothetical protein
MKKIEVTPAGESFKVTIREEWEKAALFFHLTQEEAEHLHFLLGATLQEEEGRYCLLCGDPRDVCTCKEDSDFLNGPGWWEKAH